MSNDLVFGVRINGDASGLVGQARAAQAELRQLGAAAGGAGAAASEGAAGMEAMAGANAAAGRSAQGATSALNAETRAATADSVAMAELTAALRAATAATTAAATATTEAVVSFGAMAGGAEAAGAAMGVTAVAAEALEAVLTAGLSLAIAAVTALVIGNSAALGDNETQHRSSITAADALGQAQSALGEMFDLATGKVISNSEALRLNTIQIALNMRAQAARQAQEAGETLAGAGDASWGSILNRLGAAASGNVGQLALSTGAHNYESTYVNTILAGVRNRTIDPGLALTVLSSRDFSTLAHTGSDIANALNDQVQAREASRIADETLRSALTGQLDPALRRPDRDPNRGRGSGSGSGSGGGSSGSGRGADRLAEYGRDAEARIASLASGFDDTPPQIARVNKALADLDNLLVDIADRQPPDFSNLIAQGLQARQVIEDGINKPFNDFIRAQHDSLDVLRLQAAGHDDQAAAMRVILQLEQQMGPLTRDQKEEVLETVQAVQAEQRAVEVLHERQQKFLDALSQTKDLITGTVQDVLSGNLSSLRSLPGQIRPARSTFASGHSPTQSRRLRQSA